LSGASVSEGFRIIFMRAAEKKDLIAGGTVAVVFMGLALLVAACSDQPLQTPNNNVESPAPDDSSDPENTDGDDAGGAKPIKPSGCPEPPVVHPDDLPNGFLAPVTASVVRVVDGDTAHFKMNDVEVDVRFLYVNTEETHDERTTQFGIDTAKAFDKILRTAKDVKVAPEEDPKKPGSPHLDTYGRTLALVFLENELFQTRMVREGWTAYYTQFGCAKEPIHDSLLWSEAEARANERGIWEKGHPTDYSIVLADWIGNQKCRPNPYKTAYCK